MTSALEQELVSLRGVSINLFLDLSRGEYVPGPDANHRHQIEHAKCGLTEPESN